MLESLFVKDLAIVDEARVSFGEGLNIITGETGAGKSVIIGSMNLALGAKSGKSLIRRGKEFGFVELVFSVEKEMEEQLRLLDIFPEEGIVTIARRIGAERSISRINGETVTLAKVKEVSSLLLDLHGQQENHSLLSSKNHLEILDRYCGKELSSLKEYLEKSVKTYRKKREELVSYEKDLISVERELDFLRYECEEIDRANLFDGEEEELEATVKKYNYSGKIVGILNEVDELLDGKGIEEGIGKSVKLITRLFEMDNAAEGLLHEMTDIEALLSDFRSSLSAYAADMVFDEAELQQAEQRLDLIRGIYVKHGGNYFSTMKFLEESLETISKLENFSDYKENLRKEVEALEKEILETCDALTKIRKKAAAKFSEKVIEALTDLNFLQVEFEVTFEKMKEFTGKGNDEITYCISTNPGEPLRNLAEIASGGELSRIMLAIKSVMADTDRIPTLVFDEIDTGISGRTAQKVSEKLAFLSEQRQIIAITHLAQIAAMADQHYLIEKRTEKGATLTGIRKLEDKEITEELARILGGAEITETTLRSAKEMKALAGSTKKKRGN